MAVFTTITKNRLSWTAPEAVSAVSDYFLNIGDGYNLLISDTYKLVIQPGRAGTTWTPITRQKLTF